MILLKSYKKENSRIHYALFILIVVSLTGCFKNTKTMEEMKSYDGPVMILEQMETIYSDSADTKIKLKAKEQIELQNGNREFPKGLLVEFFEGGTIKSTLTSNFGRFYKDANKYMVSGNVVITDLKDGKRLNTEELFWLPIQERIYIEEDKQVIVTTKTDVLYGKGLEAKQDFSKYKIMHPSGTKIIE